MEGREDARMFKKISFSILILSFVFAIFSNISPVNALTADMELSTLKKGDVIYFDASGLDWDEVKIHIWKKNADGSGEAYKDWNNSDSMKKVSGNIYSYTVPEDMTEGKYNHFLFKNSDGTKKTIDLGFIKTGFAYKCTHTIESGENVNKLEGYWYLYDKSEQEKLLSEAKKYQLNKYYYTKDSYGDLDSLIEEASTKLNNEIVMEAEKDEKGNLTYKYYVEIDADLEKIKEITDNLVVNKEILQNKIDEVLPKLDETNVYTKVSLDNLKNEINLGKELLEKDNITVDELKNSLISIDDAASKLEAIPVVKEDVKISENPKTFDGILGTLLFGIVGILGFGFAFKKYRFNFR